MRDAPGAGCREALRTPVRALMFTFRKTAQPTGSIHSLRRFDPLLTSRKRRNDFESVPSQQFSGRVQPAYSSKLLDPAESVRPVSIKITPSSPPPKSQVRFWGRPGGGRQTSLIGDLQGNSNTVPLRGCRFDKYQCPQGNSNTVPLRGSRFDRLQCPQGNSNTVPLRGSRFDLSSNPCAPKGIRIPV